MVEVADLGLVEESALTSMIVDLLENPFMGCVCKLFILWMFLAMTLKSVSHHAQSIFAKLVIHEPYRWIWT
tara:strand:- start:515 stop:727 length:213 start_codon:yes stop_codon:yes gene_type:complete